VVSDDFDIPQGGILGTDFLNPSRPADIRYDVQEFVIWHDIKNPEVKTGLVPRLDLGEGLYAGDAIVANRNGRAYIKLANTNDADRTIADPEVELEAIEEISPHPKISKNPIEGFRTGEVNAIAIDRTRST